MTYWVPILVIGMPFLLGALTFCLALYYGNGRRGARIRLLGAHERR